MAQPPGQQPPQGSFGAPYDPPPESVRPSPPPGYGSAPPPGQAAGPYGAPVPPGPYGTPAQPGPYGVPQPGPYNAPTQPGPYGYPSSPQPGHGHPQQSQSQQPPRPGGGGFFKGGRGAVIGAVLAVVLLAGGGIWFATSGGDDGSKPTAKASTDPGPGGTGGGGDGKAEDRDAHDLRAEADALNAQRRTGEAKVLWLQEGGVDLPRNGADVYGPWIVGDTVVKGMFRTVSGYSVTDGSRKWSLRMPSSLCGAPSQPTADGKIVFGIKTGTADDAVCNSLQMVDLTTGKAGWRKTYRRQGAWDLLSDVSMAINGDTVTVGRTGRTDAFRVSDGAVLFGELPGNCQPFGFASGPVAIAATSCQTAADDHKEQQVQRIDPVTGKVRWTYKVKKGWQIAQFYSVSPLVVSLKQEDKWAIIVLNQDGTYRSQLVGGTDEYGTKCGGDLLVEGKNLDNCLGVAADDRTVYLATKPPEDDLTPTNKVVAFDLNTGQAKWKAAAPAGQSLMPIRTEGGRLLMYLAAGKNKGGGIVSLPQAGGTPQMVLRHPAAAATVERGFFDSRVAYRNGRCILVHATISGVDDEDEMSMKSMAAFGN
ncbi:PQQ-binding-like beta-propeller repeat protein [Streptomyces sp900116325]|uniref:outer membrane protein assembly factor BamB family protein n=1 Tax=Streptomyces sp. 900116325 TaxID=3154295 RepID=UPI0033212E1C